MKYSYLVSAALSAVLFSTNPAVFAEPVEKGASPAVTPAVKQEEKAEKPQVSSVEYQVPCLTVHSDDTNGKLSYMPLKFTKTQADKPLRVMVIDDTPSGSGESIRSSVWLAAVTAAMLRNDTMHGVTISVEFTGNTDGPSAGGVTCLAILSAMDGLPLPKDFAMTGTILPDGTIGVVGGVPEKMRAAAKAGVKRIFIPAFLRIFKNAKGEDVDLSRLADELKVELHRVENIEEAYAILHNKPYREEGYVNVRNMTRLPREVEDVLLPVYRDLYKKVSEKAKAKPDWAGACLYGDYVLSPEFAQSYYLEGKLLPATLQIFRSWQTWLACEKADAFLEKFMKEKSPDWQKITYLREYHLRKLLSALREASEKQEKALYEEAGKLHKESLKKLFNGDIEKLYGYFPFAKGQTEITAQIEPVSDAFILAGKLQTLSLKRSPAEKRNTLSQKELDAEWEAEVDILRMLYLVTADESSLEAFLAKLGNALPALHANSRAAEVERLFYSAFCATNSVAGQNFNWATSEKADGSQSDEVMKTEFLNNPILGPMSAILDHAYSTHGMLTDESKGKLTDPAYHLQASLKTQAEALAFSTGMLVSYGADQSNDFIPHLWRNARSSAIRNISECIKAGIPCLPAICNFEIAEASHKDQQEEIFALVSYWRASLYSKALLMSFQQPKKSEVK